MKRPAQNSPTARPRKLSLHSETLRCLTSSDLRHVGGAGTRTGCPGVSGDCTIRKGSLAFVTGCGTTTDPCG